ncbi:MAG: hypothetical protein GVY13_06350 [Alphaproteobacteria bacterium]|jgi:hypothetical protein|nr:hypothetical protein [Alphaproteobacteria bacterium]
MYDHSREVRRFHDQHVTLTREQQKQMRDRRDLNRNRIKDGLNDLCKPLPVDWINQGGYAQKTMTQPPEGDEESRYDIDMGVVFEADDAKTPKTTKGWVRDAIAKKAANLKNDPEVKSKCVRVAYADGYQCDFPVIKRSINGDAYLYEIAAESDWISSDPGSMNRWIEKQIADKSPQDNGPNQLRRIIRFVKYFAKVHSFRKNKKFPGGLLATALAIECYVPVEGRDDESVYETLRGLSHRSKNQLIMANGSVVGRKKDVERIGRLIEAAEKAVDDLDPLTKDDDSITGEDAQKAWKMVFRHSFFDKSAKSGQPAPQNSATIAGSGKSADTLASLVGGLSAEEKLRRAEAAATEIRYSGRGARPWSGLQIR